MESHALVQVLDGATGQATYHRYPILAFQAARTGFDIQIGPNHFSETGLTLDIEDGQQTLRGEIRFGAPAPVPWPVTLLSPGIMGWYAWAPFMECYHGVVSFNHGLDGELTLGEQRRDFSGGRGYIEKVWGRSFPSAWIWAQTNHFARAETCLTASIAIIPWRGSAFPGFIVGLRHNDRLYRFATYTGARNRALDIGPDQVRWVVANRQHTLEMVATRAQGALLVAPTPSAQSTCVGLGYGLMWELFPGTSEQPDQSNKVELPFQSVTTDWRTNICVLPIDYAFRPRLRGRLTLRRLALRRNPWTYGDSVSHTVVRYSCQHSDFWYLQRPTRVLLHRLTERSATAYTCVHTLSFGTWLNSRYIFGAKTLN